MLWWFRFIVNKIQSHQENKGVSKIWLEKKIHLIVDGIILLNWGPGPN